MSLTPNLKGIAALVRIAGKLDTEIVTANPEEATTLRVVSYYTRYYAVEKGLKLKKDAADEAFLETLFTCLSSARASLPAGGDDVCFKILGTYVFERFSALMDEEAMGTSTKATAQNFLECSYLHQVLKTFPKQVQENQLEADIDEKVLQCMEKAKEIARRPPAEFGTPLPPAAPAAAPAASAAPAAAAQQAVSASATVAPPTSLAPLDTVFPAQPPSPSAQLTVDTLMREQRDAKLAPPVADAIELLEFAIAHLRKNDVTGAKKQINDALHHIS